MFDFLRKEPDPRVVADPHRLPPGQVITEKWPVLHYGGVPRWDPATWNFKAYGAVEEPREWNFEEFRKLPTRSIHIDVHCVTRWSKLDMDWEGVDFHHLVELIKPHPEVRFVVCRCEQGFTTSLPLQFCLDNDALLAYRADGEELAPEHGQPLRFLVPNKYFWKSAKWLRALEFTVRDELGFWERNGYHNNADPWKEERTW
jgi:DMSO/TMAO reductase YedYZ molybdopterin-dependent catalytic subunit